MRACRRRARRLAPGQPARALLYFHEPHVQAAARRALCVDSAALADVLPELPELRSGASVHAESVRQPREYRRVVPPAALPAPINAEKAQRAQRGLARVAAPCGEHRGPRVVVPRAAHAALLLTGAHLLRAVENWAHAMGARGALPRPRTECLQRQRHSVGHLGAHRLVSCVFQGLHVLRPARRHADRDCVARRRRPPQPVRGAACRTRARACIPQ